MSGHKTSLQQCQRTEVTQSMFSDHRTIYWVASEGEQLESNQIEIHLIGIYTVVAETKNR